MSERSVNDGPFDAVQFGVQNGIGASRRCSFYGRQLGRHTADRTVIIA